MNGDCLVELKKLADNSTDSLVTDPPAGISFMGKEWDDDKGGRDGWIAWLKEVMIEVKRVLKPGAHGLVWALPRTSHWTATALEEAGFEIRDCVYHVFGSGFPKSLNISKSLDRKEGAERKIIGYHKSGIGKAFADEGSVSATKSEPLPHSPSANALQWQGWGTALKPAVECWWLIRKPLSEKTVADNVLKWGTGGINIDGCRIGSVKPFNAHAGNTGEESVPIMKSNAEYKGREVSGRFPAHLILSCICDETKEGEEIGNGHFPKDNSGGTSIFGTRNPLQQEEKHLKEKSVIHTNPECPCFMMDEQSGISNSKKLDGSSFKVEQNGEYVSNVYGKYKVLNTVRGHTDKGGASRFFYCAKTSKSERNGGLEDFEEVRVTDGRKTEKHVPNLRTTPKKNHHPTVKSQALMTYLIKLITPPKGIVLDPFMGSGSTGCACVKQGFKFIGIEKETEYFEIAKARIEFNSSKKEEQQRLA